MSATLPESSPKELRVSVRRLVMSATLALLALVVVPGSGALIWILLEPLEPVTKVMSSPVGSDQTVEEFLEALDTDVDCDSKEQEVWCSAGGEPATVYRWRLDDVGIIPVSRATLALYPPDWFSQEQVQRIEAGVREHER